MARDPQRLKEFYDELERIHREHVSDWRFGQLMSNIFGNNDIFYLEEEDVLRNIKRYFCEE